VWNVNLLEKTANVLARLGTKKSWVVHGSDGLDEITLNGETSVAEIENGEVKLFQISPDDFGLRNSSLINLQKFSTAESAHLIENILSGKANDETAKSLVLVNAAAAIYVAGKAENLHNAFDAAMESLESGNAFNKLKKLIEFTNGE
jgi:anthranilate phosphoribosyltransferase